MIETERLAALVAQMPRAPRCHIRTFGCQQNVSDSERMAGMLAECGYETADAAVDADLIIFNTCAVREHAEDRVFGNVGEIKRLKERNRELVVALGGCMVQQRHIADKLRASYPFVDIIFNTNELHKLPGHIAAHLESRRTVVDIDGGNYEIREGLPVLRDERFRAFVPVMYGCDNFCSYCVVPLVRGRERSRAPSDILAEFQQAVGEGYRDIMLLGQNVNSYGKKRTENLNFSALLRLLATVEGDYTLRFMTSHPKDATRELINTIAAHPRISRHIHLPVQSGSDRILQRMNRGYSAAQYLELIDYARERIPDITFSSDIIIGFPGETEADFEATLALVQRVGYRSLFTFIYSRREGTPAAGYPDDTPHSVKTERMARLLALQDKIAHEQELGLIGKQQRALITAELPDGRFEGRLEDNSIAVFSVREGGELPGINRFYLCTIESIHKKRLQGVIENNV